MMKKILAVTALTMGILMSGQSHAAAVSMAGTGTITPAECAVLSNNVTIQLSNKVFAAYNCTTTAVVAATCHQNGTLKVQTIPCSYLQNATTGVWEPSSPECPAYDPTATTQATSATFNGRLGYRGGSGGGSVGAINLESTVCDGAAVSAKVPDSLIQ